MTYKYRHVKCMEVNKDNSKMIITKVKLILENHNVARRCEVDERF